MRVLIADHEPMWQGFVGARLRSCGLEPIAVVNGERAWAVWQEKVAPRLVIVDRRMKDAAKTFNSRCELPQTLYHKVLDELPIPSYSRSHAVRTTLSDQQARRNRGAS